MIETIANLLIEDCQTHEHRGCKCDSGMDCWLDIAKAIHQTYLDNGWREPELKTSEEWQKLCAINVIDPDGWDRTNYEYSWHKEKLTRKEFEQRLLKSTCEFGCDLKDMWEIQPVLDEELELTNKEVMEITNAITEMIKKGYLRSDVDAYLRKQFKAVQTKLLTAKRKCKECGGSGEVQDRLAWDIPRAKEQCPVCHGTGGTPRFVEVAENQELPVCSDKSILWKAGYRNAVEDMTTPDKEGYVFMRARVRK